MDNPVFILFYFYSFILSVNFPSIFQSWRNPQQSLPVRTTSLPPPSQPYVCCVTHSSASDNALARDWKPFPLQFPGIFILHTYLFHLTLSPEKNYLYAVNVDL